MTDVEKCEINVTVGNGQKMKCELKVSVNRKLQDGQTVTLTKVLYVPQTVNVFECIKVCFKVRHDRATNDKIIIKKNKVSMILDTRKG